MTLQVEQRAVSALIPYVKNSRTHSDEQIAQIAASIREFGWTNPILIDGRDGIIAGHGRLQAARKLGLDEVPAIVLDHLSETQKRALVIADNKLALNAGWDEQMLALEIADLAAEDFDISLMGFSDAELAKYTAEKTDGLTDPDEVPEAPDALTIKNDKMGDDSFRAFLRDSYTAADAVMKPGAVFYIWHADSEGYNFRGAAKDAGWTVRQCLIWKKQTMVMGRQDYHWKHEPCLYGWKDGAAHLWATDRKQTTILEFDRPSRNAEHPTMKPVELFAYQMLNNTKGSDLVLDSFGGSGTTAIAAEMHGRHARLMELDPKYCDVIVKRWQEFTGNQAVLESDGRTFDEVAAERIA